MEDGTDQTRLPSLARDKAELLERIRSARAELERVVSGLSEEQMTAPGPDGSWSVKDHLAHVVAWEQITLAAIRGERGYEVVGMDEASSRGMDVDALNAVIYERNRDRPLPEVLADYERSHQQLLSTLEGLDDADLSRPCWPDEESPLVERIAWDTYEHYPEHAEAIRMLAGG